MIDVVESCDASRDAVLGAQSLSIVLAAVFGIYLLADSGLAAWVISRKVREAERAEKGLG
tara:strand:+ start:278 stop:457 length:180 start_codon:yes stop_codon:yes gene_type:complete